MKSFIIDCDAGIDDAQALCIAIKQHSTRTINIEMITAVSGNVGLTQVLHNIAEIQKHTHSTDIPVYAGSSRPLLPVVTTDNSATYWHGKDGLGNINDPVPETTHRCIAPEKINDMCRKKKINIVALGPLTNIALALYLDPELPNRVESLTIMGGGLYARGNHTPTAEYNAWVDPEALMVCLHAFKAITAIGWDCTMRHSVTSSWIKKVWPEQSFLRSITNIHLNKDVLEIPDPLAMIVAIDPSVIKDSKHVSANIVLSEVGRGTLLVDLCDTQTSVSKNLVYVTSLDMDKVKQYLKQSII